MKPNRKIRTSTGETYFVTSATVGRTPFFRYDRWCQLFLEVLYHYRETSFRLHEFVLMPDHFHLIVAPKESLEKAMQLIKGGFARRASLQFETREAIWQRGFTDHRIRDFSDYELHKQYIWMNPVKARLCASASEYPYSSASGRYGLDPIPQGLKPLVSNALSGTAEAVPFPKYNNIGGAEALSFHPQGLKPLGLGIVNDTAKATLSDHADTEVNYAKSQNDPQNSTLAPPSPARSTRRYVGNTHCKQTRVDVLA